MQPAIRNIEKVTAIYGKWPRFHDANVVEYTYDDTGALFITLQTWVMTNEITPKGYFVTEKHHEIRLKFSSLSDIQMTNFGTGNILYSLEISTDDAQGFKVILDSVMDMDGAFTAKECEVESVTAYTPSPKDG